MEKEVQAQEEQKQEQVFDPDKFIDSTQEESAEEIDHSGDAADQEEKPIPDGQQHQQEQEPAPTEGQLDEYFMALKEEVGELDEDIINVFKTGKTSDGQPLTPQQKLNMLKDFVMDNVMLGGDPETDQFIRSYMVAANTENFNRQEFLNNYVGGADIDKMNSKDFLKFYYRQSTKDLNVPESAIEQKVNNMNELDVELEAKKLKDQYRALQQKNVASVNETAMKSYQQRMEKDMTKQNENISTMVKEFVEKSIDKKNLGGFELDESDKKAFLDNLPSFLEKKIQDTGNGGKVLSSDADLALGRVLAKPESLFNLVVYLYMVENNKMDGYVSNLKERIKKGIADSLDEGQESQVGKGNQRSSSFDADRFIDSAGS